MKAEETRFFKLVEGWARETHNCFLAEFFDQGTNYHLCFRPTSVTVDQPDRYACRYLVIGAEQVQRIGAQSSLPNWAVKLLDPELLEFRKHHQLL